MKSNTMFPSRLALLRKQADLSQAEFAKKLSLYMGRDITLSNASISGWELGNKTPSIPTTVAIANFFGVSLDYLFGISNTATKSIYKMEDYSEPISQEDLAAYDGRPVYLIFDSDNSLNRWGIYNKEKDYFYCSDEIIKNDPALVHLYALEPTQNISSKEANPPLSMRELLDCKHVWICYLSTDLEIKTRNTGWYKHVGEKSNAALQNEEGIMLPYSGLDISYRAYKRKP